MFFWTDKKYNALILEMQTLTVAVRDLQLTKLAERKKASARSAKRLKSAAWSPPVTEKKVADINGRRVSALRGRPTALRGKKKADTTYHCKELILKSIEDGKVHALSDIIQSVRKMAGRPDLATGSVSHNIVLLMNGGLIDRVERARYKKV